MSAARRPRPGVMAQARALLEGSEPLDGVGMRVRSVEQAVWQFSLCSTTAELDAAWLRWCAIWFDESDGMRLGDDDAAIIVAVGTAWRARWVEVELEAAEAARA